MNTPAEILIAPGPWTYDEMGGFVYAGTPAAMETRICDMRGWGYLTGQGALALPEDEAERRQTATGRLIASLPDLVPKVARLLAENKRITEENERLRAKVEKAHALAAEVDGLCEYEVPISIFAARDAYRAAGAKGGGCDLGSTSP